MSGTCNVVPRPGRHLERFVKYVLLTIAVCSVFISSSYSESFVLSELLSSGTWLYECAIKRSENIYVRDWYYKFIEDDSVWVVYDFYEQERDMYQNFSATGVITRKVYDNGYAVWSGTGDVTGTYRYYDRLYQWTGSEVPITDIIDWDYSYGESVGPLERTSPICNPSLYSDLASVWLPLASVEAEGARSPGGPVGVVASAGSFPNLVQSGQSASHSYLDTTDYGVSTGSGSVIVVVNDQGQPVVTIRQNDSFTFFNINRDDYYFGGRVSWGERSSTSYIRLERISDEPVDYTWTFPNTATMGEFFPISLSVDNKSELDVEYDFWLEENQPVPPPMDLSEWYLDGEDWVEGRIKTDQTIAAGETNQHEYTIMHWWEWIPPLSFSKLLWIVGNNVIDKVAVGLGTLNGIVQDVKTALNAIESVPYDYIGYFDGEAQSAEIVISVPQFKQVALAASITLAADGSALLLMPSPVSKGMGALAIMAALESYVYAADPPDDQYWIVGQPEYSYPTLLSQELNEDEQQITRAAFEVAAYMSCARQAFERYQGARDAGALEWADFQLALAMSNVATARDRLGYVSSEIDDYLPAVWPTLEEIQAAQDEIRLNGLPEFESAILIELGFAEEEVSEIALAIADLDASPFVHRELIHNALQIAWEGFDGTSSGFPVTQGDIYIASVTFDPQTINKRDHQGTISCYIEIPDLTDIASIDISSITLDKVIHTLSQAAVAGDFDNDLIPDIEVQFGREDIVLYLGEAIGVKQVTVSGSIGPSGEFVGSELLSVIDRPLVFDLSGFVFLPDSSGAEGVTLDLCDNQGVHYASLVTDESGHFEIDSIPNGEYTITLSSPLGYVTNQETMAISGDFEPVIISFFLTQMEVPMVQRGRGYWMHQVVALLTGKGKPQESYEDMCVYVEHIRIHFNEHGLNPVTVFEVDLNSDCNARLEALRTTISPKPNSTMNEKARAHLTALLLNMASGKIAQWQSISEDSMSVSQAITFCNALITDGSDENDVIAKDIAEMINEGQTVPAGWIDPLTADFAYRQAAESFIPTEYALSQNYPNPFNPITEISFSLPVASEVKLDVFNLMGQKVTTVFEGSLEAGIHTFRWDGSSLASGIYLYRLAAGDFLDAKKMVLLK